MSEALVNEVGQLERWGKFAIEAGLIPADVSLPQAMAIIQTGKEMGLQPLQSLRNMAFIRGRLTMAVQLQLALAIQKGVKIVEMAEELESCTITLERTGEKITCTYTLEDAKKAGLFKSAGNYEKYLKQMLRWRATGDCLRLIAPDLILGLLSPEEAESLEPLGVAPAIVKTPQSKSQKAINPVPVPVLAPAGEFKTTTGIAKITTSKGANKTTGQEFTLYKIFGEGDIVYSSFDEKIATLAKTASEAGLKVEITHKSDKFNSIVAIDIIEPTKEVEVV